MTLEKYKKTNLIAIVIMAVPAAVMLFTEIAIICFHNEEMVIVYCVSLPVYILTYLIFLAVQICFRKVLKSEKYNQFMEVHDEMADSVREYEEKQAREALENEKRKARRTRLICLILSTVVLVIGVAPMAIVFGLMALLMLALARALFR